MIYAMIATYSIMCLIVIGGWGVLRSQRCVPPRFPTLLQARLAQKNDLTDDQLRLAVLEACAQVDEEPPGDIDQSLSQGVLVALCLFLTFCVLFAAFAPVSAVCAMYLAYCVIDSRIFGHLRFLVWARQQEAMDGSTLLLALVYEVPALPGRTRPRSTGTCGLKIDVFDVIYVIVIIKLALNQVFIYNQDNTVFGVYRSGY